MRIVRALGFICLRLFFGSEDSLSPRFHIFDTFFDSEDSLSLKSISVDETPETEVDKDKVEKTVEVESVDIQVVEGKNSIESKLLPNSASLLLSPPDVSTASASPGEETDHTVTEASSTAVTPSLSDRLSPKPEDNVQLRADGLLQGSRDQRNSCPAIVEEKEASGPVQRTCRRSVPEGLESQHEWLKVDTTEHPSLIIHIT